MVKQIINGIDKSYQPYLGYTPLDIAGSNSMAADLLLSGHMLHGNSTSGGSLTLMSTSHATKGNIYQGTSYYDETNDIFNMPGTLGTELVSNGDFATDTVWTKGAQWTISGGKAVHTAGQNNLSQSISITSGNYYQIQFDIVAISGGSLGVQIGSQSGIYFNNVQTVKTVMNATASGSLTLSFIPINATVTCTIDNVSVKQIVGGHLVANRIVANRGIALPFGAGSNGEGGIQFYRNVGDVTAIGVLSYNDNVGFVIIGTLNGSTYVGTGNFSLVKGSLQTTSTDGFMAANVTASTAGVPVQISPRLRLSGTVYDTGTTSSKTDNWKIETLPVSANPASSTLIFGWDTNGGGYNNKMTLTSAGGLACVGGFGCNTKAAQTAYASGGAVTDTATLGGYGFTDAAHFNSMMTLLANIRTALVNNGIMS